MLLGVLTCTSTFADSSRKPKVTRQRHNVGLGFKPLCMPTQGLLLISHDLRHAAVGGADLHKRKLSVVCHSNELMTVRTLRRSLKVCNLTVRAAYDTGMCGCKQQLSAYLYVHQWLPHVCLYDHHILTNQQGLAAAVRQEQVLLLRCK
jgi:hypothetical protein